MKKKSFKMPNEDSLFKTSIELREFKSSLENRYDDPYGAREKPVDLNQPAEAPSYEVIGKEGHSKGQRLLSRLKSKKEMVILSEIMGKPKGF